MKCKWTVKPTKTQKWSIKRYIKAFGILRQDFHNEVSKLEDLMRAETQIDDIEFSQGDDGQYIGVGNSSRTMDLIQFE